MTPRPFDRADRPRGASGRRPLRRPGGRRRHHRRRRAPSTPRPGACAPRSSSGTTSPPAPRRSPRSWSTAASATSSRARSGLVYEALAERQRLRRNAPHLVKVLPFLIPMLRQGRRDPGQDRPGPGQRPCGCTTSPAARASASSTSGSRPSRGAGPHAHAARRAAGCRRTSTTTPAADDARLVLTVARTAALDHGAVVANRVAAVGDRPRTPPAGSTASTVEADGERHRRSRARAVVNAAGVWADDVRALDEGTDPDSIRPAKGIHITVPWDKVRNDIAVVIPVPKDKRSVFVVPWGDFTYIGTTDTDYDGPVDDPQCTPDDVAYLLRRHQLLRARPSITDRRHRRHLGRPAPAGEGRDQRAAPPTCPAATRCTAPTRGVVTITGGKLTTYREMAADTVDEVVEHRAAAAARRRRLGRSRTKQLAPPRRRGLRRPWPTRPGLRRPRAALVEHLADRYGGEARGAHGHRRGRPRAGRAPRARPPLPAGRGRLRRALRDGPHGRRRAEPPHPGPPAGPRRLGRRPPPRSAALIGAELGLGRPTSEARQVAAYARLGRPPSAPAAAACPRSRSTRRRRPDGRPRPLDLPIDAGARRAHRRPSRLRRRAADGHRAALDGRRRRRCPTAVDACGPAARRVRRGHRRPAERAEASRDWWPLAMTWALDGQVAGRGRRRRAGPTTADEVAAVLRRLPRGPRARHRRGRPQRGLRRRRCPLFGGVVLDLCGLTGIRRVDDATSLVDVLRRHLRRPLRARAARRPRPHRAATGRSR